MKIIQLTEAETRRNVEAIVDVVRDVLVTEQPQVVMMALEELTARFMSCHAPEIRSEMRAAFNRELDRMVPLLVEVMIKQGAANEAWREPTKQ